jgi:hypothetical protein
MEDMGWDAEEPLVRLVRGLTIPQFNKTTRYGPASKRDGHPIAKLLEDGR